MDPMGRAILDYVKRQGRAADYHKSKKASKLRVFSPMFEEDEIPLTTLFRSYEDMPEIELPDDMGYYGEHSFRMQYKDTIGEPFDWLYIDADTLKQKAGRCGYTVELVAEGEHYDYLARITKKT